MSKSRRVGRANGIGDRTAVALPSFASLRAFEAVFRTGGIRRAAESLGVNHAVICRHLKSLECWVGVSLIKREDHRLRLTEAGALYHCRVSAALRELSVATQEVVGAQRADHVRLWCVPGLSIQWLSKQLAEFERAYPAFSVELKPSDAPAGLVNYEADADIRYQHDSDPIPFIPGVKRIELARPAIYPVASPELVANSQSLNSIRDLAEVPLLHENDRDEWRTWLRLNGLEIHSELPGPLCWHAHLAISAARLGRGVALASRFLIADDLEAGNLVELQVAGTKPVPLGSYVFLAREDRWSTPALAALRGFLRSKAIEESRRV